MQISRITAHVLRADLARPFRFSQWAYSQRAAALVRVETSDGIVGWGEAYGPPEVAAEAVRSHFTPLLLGRDPRRSTRAWPAPRAAPGECAASALAGRAPILLRQEVEAFSLTEYARR